MGGPAMRRTSSFAAAPTTRSKPNYGSARRWLGSGRPSTRARPGASSVRSQPETRPGPSRPTPLAPRPSRIMPLTVKRPRVMATLIPILVAIAALALLVRWLEPRMAFFPFPGEDETPQHAGIPFEALTIHTSDGERLRAWLMTPPAPQAARARIVYFHGNGGNLSNWSPILTTIVRHGYAVLAVDYRGYGLSTGRPTERGLYRDVDAVVAHPWPGPFGALPLIYWGRSLGGAMAAYAASARKP